MSGTIVIANRTMAARDILSGTIHKLTLWRDDVRRKPAMKLLLRQTAVDEIGYGTTPTDEEGSRVSPDASHLYSIQCALDGTCQEITTCLGASATASTIAREVEKRTAFGRRRERKCPSIESACQLERQTTSHFNTRHIKKS